MKKLLIIQQDDAYFLFETLLVLEKNRSAFKEFDVSVLVNDAALKYLQTKSITTSFKVVTQSIAVLNQKFDLSFNLSQVESSWLLHSAISSSHKIGPYYKNEQLIVPDSWSSYYLTLKGKAPFLTFHLQDIFKNILGIKRFASSEQKRSSIRTVAFGITSSQLMNGSELEKLVNEVHSYHPQISIVDVHEIDPVEDLSHVLYIGPATLEALILCESGAQGIFLSSGFQGLNLIPYGENNLILSTRGKSLKCQDVFGLIQAQLNGTPLPQISHSLYRLAHENLFGVYLTSLNSSDDSYPVYQSHVVLWNFLLNLFDTNLEITSCSKTQLDLLKHNKMVLTKLIRLYDYAMSSIDTIHFEAKAQTSHNEIISGHLKNLQEIEVISDQISQSHVFLRPILDFYKIRRGQNEGSTLLEQAQHSFLTYSEEHQALKALDELFSVTLNKNEVNI